MGADNVATMVVSVKRFSQHTNITGMPVEEHTKRSKENTQPNAAEYQD